MLRQITLGEMAMAKTIFGNSMSYNVWVHCDSYLPFGMQSDNVAMAPNGDIYFRELLYRHDFSEAFPDFQHLFIHELTHVWQHQNGMWVRTRGLFSSFANYSYILDGKKKLSDYGMEKQANIVADYFILKKFGIGEFMSGMGTYIGFNGHVDKNTIMDLYRATLPNTIL
ncbi:type IV secretion protein Rhs [Morganella morganii]|nr:type IV secretion protein Rhs [Morganella morganii]